MQEDITFGVLEESVVAELRTQMRGELVQPGEEGYDETRKYGLTIDSSSPHRGDMIGEGDKVVTRGRYTSPNGEFRGIRPLADGSRSQA